MCPTLPNFFRPVTRNTLIFLFGLITYEQTTLISAHADTFNKSRSNLCLSLHLQPYFICVSNKGSGEWTYTMGESSKFKKS